jgi:glycine/D-amino acid oxidase-like deaminating enzyme
VLHERRGGWADAMQTVRHLADRARRAGAEIREGVEVVGFALGEDGVESIATSEERLACDTVVVAPGPWVAGLWSMLGLTPDVEVAGERRPLVSSGRRRRASSR